MTYRELQAAAKCKQTVEWDRTASLLSMMFNLWTTGQRTNPTQHNPMREDEEVVRHDLDDPAAEYERLMAQRNGNGHHGARRG